jgi:hypothetical protein
MSRFKDFGSGTSKPVEPISFKLHNEEFTCRSAIQGRVLLDLVAKSANTNPSETADAINNFFKVVLTDESYARFDALAVDPDRIVSMDTIGDIIEWLVEQYSDRPTSRPEVSSSGE